MNNIEEAYAVGASIALQEAGMDKVAADELAIKLAAGKVRSAWEATKAAPKRIGAFYKKHWNIAKDSNKTLAKGLKLKSKYEDIAKADKEVFDMLKRDRLKSRGIIGGTALGAAGALGGAGYGTYKATR